MLTSAHVVEIVSKIKTRGHCRQNVAVGQCQTPRRDLPLIKHITMWQIIWTVIQTHNTILVVAPVTIVVVDPVDEEEAERNERSKADASASPTVLELDVLDVTGLVEVTVLLGGFEVLEGFVWKNEAKAAANRPSASGVADIPVGSHCWT